MVSRRFEFLFDVGGPNAYLTHKVLPAFCAAHGSEAVYVPILLGGLFKLTNNQAPLIRYAETPAKRDYEMLEFRRFIEAHKIPFSMNPKFPMNTMLAMRGAVAAEGMGMMAPYVDAVMAAMWEEGADVSNREVLHNVADAAGLDGAAIVAATDDPAVKAKLAANTEAAAARGAFGVPTFFVGDEIFWGKERLGQVAAALR
jgi:2-hydroxychromene-2-carboxylate isomerase